MSTMADLLATNTQQAQMSSLFIDQMGLVSVKSYDATGDGVTNDTVFITACVTAATEAGLGSIFFPHGTYLVDAGTATLLEDFFLWGDNSTITGDTVTINQMGPNLSATVDAHIADLANPHEVVASQVTITDAGGYYGTTNLNAALQELGFTTEANFAEIDDHIGVTSGNPHQVTKTEVGLGSAENTADIDKIVSTLQALAIADAKNISDANAATLTDGSAADSLHVHEVVPDNAVGIYNISAAGTPINGYILSVDTTAVGGFRWIPQTQSSSIVATGTFSDNGLVLVNPCIGAAQTGEQFGKHIVSANATDLFFTNGLHYVATNDVVTVLKPDGTVRGTVTITNHIDEWHSTYTTLTGSAPVTGDTVKTTHESTMIAMRVLWSLLEPTKGVYDWTALEALDNKALTMARVYNMRVSLTFHMDLPSGTAHKDIPQWLYDEMVAEGNAGTAYNNSGLQGFSPNYASPTLIARNALLLDALATYLTETNDANLYTIKIGSLGHWGEVHTFYAGAGTFPNNTIADQYVQHYIDSFGGKCHMTARRPLGTSGKFIANKIGGFNDSFADYEDVYNPIYLGSNPQWENGYTDSDGYVHSAVPNWRTYAPVSGEPVYPILTSGAAVYSWTILDAWDNTAYPYIKQQTEDLQISYQNFELDWLYSSTDGNVEDFLKFMGYRYYISNYTLASNSTSITQGSILTLDITLANVGSAGIYDDFEIELSIIDSGNTVVQTYNTGISIKNGTTNSPQYSPSITIGALTAGSYSLAIGFIDPLTTTPNLKLAQSVRSDNRHIIVSSLTIM